MFRKNPFLNLEMGLVKENYIVIDNKDIKLWQSRGFEKIKKYPLFLYEPCQDESIMLGRPLYIDEFGIANFKNSKILEVSTYCGSYGMGGPGFFGIKFYGSYGIRWLIYCIWNAGEHILFNGRVIECHPLFMQKYNPWIGHNGDMDRLNEILSGLIVSGIKLTDTEIIINLEDDSLQEYTICSYKYSDYFPEQGGTKKKRNSFDSGIMKDYWLVTYDGTVLSI